jgi:hypothetical protein
MSTTTSSGINISAFSKAAHSAFDKYAQLVQSYATDTVLDLMFLDFSHEKEADKRFAAQKWEVRSLYSNPRTAFKPIVPFAAQEDHPLNVYYNDLYGILFARAHGEFRTEDLNLSSTAVKWSV